MPADLPRGDLLDIVSSSNSKAAIMRLGGIAEALSGVEVTRMISQTSCPALKAP